MTECMSFPALRGSEGYAVPADAVFPPFCALERGAQRSGALLFLLSSGSRSVM